MSNYKQILTVEGFSEFKLKEKSSLFHGFSFHVENDEDATLNLDSLRKKYFDATHHCYAFKIKSDKIKYSDDGEPNGTAGIRILQSIEHFQLTDVLVVVVRYFGGTKLGTGPLGKAYFDSALNTLEIAKKKILNPFGKITIIISFDLINHVYRLTENENGIIKDSFYGDNAKFEILLPPNSIKNFNTEISNISKGKVEININQEIIYM